MASKVPLNLTLDDDLIEQIKIQAVRERRSVSQIVEQLLREYLGRQRKEKRKKE